MLWPQKTRSMCRLMLKFSRLLRSLTSWNQAFSHFKVGSNACLCRQSTNHLVPEDTVTLESQPCTRTNVVNVFKQGEGLGDSILLERHAFPWNVGPSVLDFHSEADERYDSRNRLEKSPKFVSGASWIHVLPFWFLSNSKDNLVYHFNYYAGWFTPRLENPRFNKCIILIGLWLIVLVFLGVQRSSFIGSQEPCLGWKYSSLNRYLLISKAHIR